MLLAPAVRHGYESTGECTKASTNTAKRESDIYMPTSNSQVQMRSSRWPNSTA